MRRRITVAHIEHTGSCNFRLSRNVVVNNVKQIFSASYSMGVGDSRMKWTASVEVNPWVHMPALKLGLLGRMAAPKWNQFDEGWIVTTMLMRLVLESGYFRVTFTENEVREFFSECLRQAGFSRMKRFVISRSLVFDRPKLVGVTGSVKSGWDLF